MNFLKANWAKIVLLLIGVFLLFILFRKYSPGADIKQDRKEVDSVVVLMDQQRINYSSAIMRKNKEIDSIAREQHKTQIEANTARQKIQQLIAKGTGIVKAAPTEISQERNFDSLANAFNDLAETTETFVAVMDTLVEQLATEMDLKDSVINLQVNFIQDMKNTNLQLLNKYGKLEKDYIKSEKRRKGNAVLNKILAGALIVAGGIAIAK